MPDDLSAPLLSAALLAGDAPCPDSGATRWNLLERLESAGIGQRGSDGTIHIRRRERAGCFLYGPYLHLPEGDYRLTFRCKTGKPRLRDQPVLGIEVIVLSRFQQQWRDFTAAELSGGTVSFNFTVPYEHSLESDNEGRFEFRFFHLGNADLSVTLVILEQLPVGRRLSEPRRWRLLGRLNTTWLARRTAGGGISVSGLAPAGCLLYGGWPYLRLPRGQYRVRLHGRAMAGAAESPVLGIEIIASNRWRGRTPIPGFLGFPVTKGVMIAHRDVTADELAAGAAEINFSVPEDVALEGGADAPFDVRVQHLGGRALQIDAIELVELWHHKHRHPDVPTWNLLAHLAHGRVGEWRGNHLIVHAGEEAAAVLRTGHGSLQLPEGRFRLTLAGDTDPADDRGLLDVEITMRPPHGQRPFARRPCVGVATAVVRAAELAAGSAGLDFTVAPEQALGTGNWHYAINLHNLGAGGFTLHRLDLRAEAGGGFGAPALRPTGRRKIVIIGNCQSEVLRQGFVHSETLNRLFDVKYHFVQLPPNLHKFAARDLETCDILMIQDIAMWDDFPLKDRVRPGADIFRFPLVRFASPWPFDSWNGPGDKVAYEREAPNLTFPYLDGLLGRLRKEVPDRAERFAAYKSLEYRGIVNYRRLHDLEVRRLESLDKKFGTSIGRFILENFRERRLFHTTARPNWEVFAQLMEFVMRQVGAPGPISVNPGIDTGLRNPQVPIHPKVAHDLGIRWVDETTRYLNRGREITWETYIRDYIEHYG